MRGWYILLSPDEQQGNSTARYTSFWGFCGAYLDESLDKNWCLSQEQSIQIHIGDKTIPSQLLVRSQALFGPSVTASCIKQPGLASYRTRAVYIRKSKHTLL